MRKNKISAMFLILVLALTGVGVSYAGFTDSISVYGTVNTGTVNIDWIGAYSSTWVWKVWGEGAPANEIIISHDPQFVPDYENKLLVAWSYAEEYDGTDYDINMVYHNLFPCIDFEADFIFHYGGSVPAKINVAEIFPITEENGFLTFLWNYHLTNPGYGAWVEAYRAYPDGNGGFDIEYDEPVDVGYQLHNCYYVYVKLVIHLPQLNELQGLTGTFGGNIGVLQWNDMCTV